MAKNRTKTVELIVEVLDSHGLLSSKEIYKRMNTTVSYATIKRILAETVETGIVKKIGAGKSTKYTLHPDYNIIKHIDPAAYFKNEVDEREIKDRFDLELVNKRLRNLEIFTQSESVKLNDLRIRFQNKIKTLGKNEYENELERLAIDLSWKSSQIEGNTYTLLETERLLKEKQTASGRTKDEAVMLLNHKDAIDFLVSNPDYIHPLTIKSIEDIHSILINDLGISRNLRMRGVGITGTNYRPLENEWQIREALELFCELVNDTQDVFTKAFLTLVLISYIQPFNDGNKRTARILCNAILMHFGHIPLSFRTVNSIDYKKAMLIFYEQHNISVFKNIFIEQYEFAVETYF